MITYTYHWRSLENGLLVEVEPTGPYYCQVTLNGYEGCFDSIEEAEQGVIAFKDAGGWLPCTLVLITEATYS